MPDNENAPLEIPVKDLGATMQGECKIKIPGACIADTIGAVKAVKVGDDEDQTLVCIKCYEQMRLAKQWVSAD